MSYVTQRDSVTGFANSSLFHHCIYLRWVTRGVMEHKCLFVYDMFRSYRKLKQRKTSWLDFFVLRPNIFYEKMLGFYCFSKLYLLKDWLSPIPNIGVSQYLSELEYQLITQKCFLQMSTEYWQRLAGLRAVLDSDMTQQQHSIYFLQICKSLKTRFVMWTDLWLNFPKSLV